MRVLVAGWFSFSQMGATAGDLLSRDVACRWLDEAGVAFDVATAKPFTDGIDWRGADPRDYSHVIFICGPFGNGDPVTGFLEHFRGRRFIGLNLSMLEPLEAWNPFDLLIERDSSREVRPDLVFLSPTKDVPVVGIILAHVQKEYRKGALHQAANAAIHRLTTSREMARFHIDTCLDPYNKTAFRSEGEIEAAISRMDLVVTTRLHGMVLALKNGVPAVVVDPVSGGAKIRRQAEAIGWPACLTADAVTDEKLAAAFEYCLSDEAHIAVQQCQETAADKLRGIRRQLLDELAPPSR